MRPIRSLPLVGGLLLGGLARQTGAVHNVGVQHLQQQVIQRHHVLQLHAVEVVHAFVAAQFKESIKSIKGWSGDENMHAYISMAQVAFTLNGGCVRAA